MKIQIKTIVMLICAGFFSCYFVYSALNGQFGTFNQYKYKAQEKVLIANLNEIRSTTRLLEKRVSRLSENFLDMDLLDEQARKVLGLAKANEIILELR